MSRNESCEIVPHFLTPQTFSFARLVLTHFKNIQTQT